MTTSVKSSFAHIVQEPDRGTQAGGGGPTSSPWWSAWTPAPVEQLAARALAGGLLVGVEHVIAGDDIALCPALLGDDGIERVLDIASTFLCESWRPCVLHGPLFAVLRDNPLSEADRVVQS